MAFIFTLPPPYPAAAFPCGFEIQLTHQIQWEQKTLMLLCTIHSTIY